MFNYKKVGIVVMILLMLFSPSAVGLMLDSFAADEKDDVITYEKNIKLLLKESGEIINCDLDEYVKNVLMCELPLDFEDETAKALAIALRSSVFYRIDNGYGKNEHGSADVCDDHTHCFGYISASDVKEMLGEKMYGIRFDRIEKAVEETRGKVLFYEGDHIEANFYYTTFGISESGGYGMDIYECNMLASEGKDHIELLSIFYPKTEVSTVQK